MTILNDAAELEHYTTQGLNSSNECNCNICRHSRGEWTNDELLMSLVQRLEVWLIVKEHLETCSTEGLKVNTDYAIDSLTYSIDELLNKEQPQQCQAPQYT